MINFLLILKFVISSEQINTWTYTKFDFFFNIANI